MPFGWMRFYDSMYTFKKFCAAYVSQMPFGWMLFYDQETCRFTVLYGEVANAFRLNAVLRSQTFGVITDVLERSQMPFGWMLFYDSWEQRDSWTARHVANAFRLNAVLRFHQKVRLLLPILHDVANAFRLNAVLRSWKELKESQNLQSQMPFGWMRFYGRK